MIRAAVVRDPTRGFDLCLYVWDTEGERSAVALPVVFQAQPPDGRSRHLEPTIIFTAAEAQTLADSLWDAGVRPDGAKGSAGQLAAVESHLSDVRAVMNRLMMKVLE
jgi:hypothetical protein